jgi:hypothetical protein
MHRDVKKELQAGRAGCTQEAFDLWRQEFNTERPHESLGMATPAECYQPSVRPYEGTPEVLDYQGRETRRVRKNGTICFSCEPILISTSLAGWDVAFGEQEDNRIELWFSSLLLGHLHTDTLSFRPATPPPAGGATGGLAASAPLQRPNHRSNA